MDVSSPENRVARGCVVLLVLGALIATGGWWAWSRSQEAARSAAEAAARSEFEPLFQKLDAAAANPAAPYDIDRTMRVLHELDEAMREAPDPRAYLERLMQADYTGVAPEVLRARAELLRTLFPLYARQTEAEDQEAMWQVTTETILKVVSVVDAPGGVPVSVDRKQAQELLRQAQEERATRRQLQREIHDLETELLDGVLAWSETRSRFVGEWEKLCIVRDRAYLAAAAGDWAATAAAAEEAIRLAPDEREAHLLLALAAIEGDRVADVDVERLLDGYVARHPRESAPALLLKGAWLQEQGRADEALRAFEESAKQYPQQAEALTDLANPYRARAWLGRTREGTYILRLYEATMLGAGYFSPDLQQARAYFDRGEREKGRQKVLDHFFRRRGQAQWDLLLDDLRFCEQFLGEEFRSIFPEDSFLDLSLDETLIGDALALGVDNRSDRSLHNATLLLCLQLTDLHPSDYEVVRVEPTKDVVPAHTLTKFGQVEIAVEVFGATKGRADVIFDTTRAILIANEGVMWVDTEAFKEAARKAPRAAPPSSGALSTASELLRSQASVEVEKVRLLKDDVVVTLPRQLIVLAPLFRLRVGGEEHAGAARLDGDRITVRFEGVHEWEPGAPSPDLSLVALGPGASLRLDFSGDSTLRYVLTRVETE